MTSPLLHAASKRALEGIVTHLPQSLLVSGPVGIGFSGVVQYLTQKLRVTPLVILPEKDEKVDLEKGTITIAIIRRLYDQTKTKSLTERLVVIDHAERMATPAQNAFLKLLEEPGEKVHFILLTHAPSLLLPTIHSRVEHLELRPITTRQSERLLDDLNVTAARKRAQLLFIGSGLPAELSRLALDEAYFDARSQIVRDARGLLQDTTYEKLKIIEKYREKRPEALQLLLNEAHLVEQNLKNGAHNELIKKLDLLLESHDRIVQNGNIRLWLARTVL